MLVDAARRGDLLQVRSLISQGQNIDARDASGDTALIAAAEAGHSAVVDFLIAHGAELDARCNNGIAALYAATLNSHHEVLQKLLEVGANPSILNAQSYSPLLRAAYATDAHACELLLKHGADPNIVTDTGLAPLHAAAFHGHLQIVEALLKAGANLAAVSHDGATALGLAANRGHLEVVRRLLTIDRERALEGMSPAHLLAFAMSAPRDAESIAIAIVESAGAPTDSYRGFPSLYHAVAMAQHRVLEALLKAGADSNQRVATEQSEISILTVAATQGNAAAVTLLLDYGADPNPADGSTPLLAAQLQGHPDIVAILLQRRASITGPSSLVGGLDGSGGFVVGSDLARDLIEVCKIAQASDDMSPEGLASELWDAPYFSERFGELLNASSQLIGMSRQDVENTIRPYLNGLITLFQGSVQLMQDVTAQAVKIVIANHVGLPKRKTEEERARIKCVEELASLIARHVDIYEDGDEALALAEFVLYRLPYRSLVDLARRSNIDGGSMNAGGIQYEDDCRDQLVQNDFTVRKTPVTGDQGADLIASKNGVTYAIQCKNYAGSVGNAAVQEALSAKAFYGTDYAVVVSNGKFTTSARELAARTKVVLVTREGIKNIDVVCATLA